MLTAPYTQGFQNQQPAIDRSGLLRRAFFNQYNLILLGGAGAFALALASYLPVIAAGVGRGVLDGHRRGHRLVAWGGRAAAVA